MEGWGHTKMEWNGECSAELININIGEGGTKKINR